MKNIFAFIFLMVALLGTAQKQTTDSIHKGNPFMMDEVIVSSAFKKLQSQTVMKVEHKKIKDNTQNGAVTLIDGLSNIPGVSQVSTGISIGKPVIRGLSANRVLVYTQGIRLEIQQFGSEHGLGLNGAGLESVELIKGPGSLLYGSDAMGGVLYFNPEKFADSNTVQADFGQKLFSNTNGTSTELGAKVSNNNWKFLVRANYDSHADYKIANHDRITNTRFNEKDFKTGFGYTNDILSTVLRYNFNNLKIGIPEFGVAQQTTTKAPDYPSQAVDNHVVSLNNMYKFNTSKLELNLGYITNTRKEFEDSPEAVLHLKLNTFNYDVKYHLPKHGPFETIVGVQGMNQTNTNFGEEFLIPNAKTIDNGVFATSVYEFGKNSLQLGLRFDNRRISVLANAELGEENYFEAFTQNYNSLNGAVGFKTSLTDKIPLRINIATGFRAPNLSELSSNGVHEGTNRFEIGNANLKTEQNMQIDVNLDCKTSHLEFFANGFYNKINNYIYIAPNGDTDIDGNEVFNYLQSNAMLYGGELGLHFHPHPLDWLHFETSFESVTAQQQNGSNLPLIPANRSNNNIKFDLKPAKWLENSFIAINVSHFLNQNKISNFETPTTDYTLVNLALFGKIKFGKTVFETTINANNLFNKDYIAHLSRLKTDGIPNIGRNIILSLNFKI